MPDTEIPLSRKLAEAAMSLIHHDASEPERGNEMRELEKNFRRILSGSRASRAPDPSRDAAQQGPEIKGLDHIPRLTSGDDAPPTESILHPLADREKSADPFDRAQEKRRHAAALITDAEALEQLAYDTADYCGGGEP